MAIFMEEKSATSPGVVEVGIRDLRDGLSRYLDAVAGGARIVVTAHGKPVAQITSLEEPPRLARLMEEGRVTPAARPKTDPGSPIDLGASVLDLLDR